MRIEDKFTIDTTFTDFKSKETTANKENAFTELLNSISEQENMVSQMKTEYLNGERDDIENVLIEGQKANLQINFALQVRNNLVNAIQQLMSMQV